MAPAAAKISQNRRGRPDDDQAAHRQDPSAMADAARDTETLSSIFCSASSHEVESRKPAAQTTTAIVAAATRNVRVSRSGGAGRSMAPVEPAPSDRVSVPSRVTMPPRSATTRAPLRWRLGGVERRHAARRTISYVRAIRNESASGGQ
jgi:hypothetical protein